MIPDDLQVPAEMFSSARKAGWSRAPMTYRRFDTLALAIKFAVEDLGTDPSFVTIRTDNEDITGADIRKIYDATGFPLDRKAATGA
jgi:hypothetical protein